MGFLHELRVHLALLLTQLLVTSSTLIARRLLVAGMDQVVYSFYCSLTALLVVGPFAYFSDIERKFQLLILAADARLPLLLNGFLCFLLQPLCTSGIKNTSANFFTAMQPSIPVFGTLFALIMRLERLNWSRLDGKVKVGGILLCTLGASLMAVWQGPRLFGGKTSPTHLIDSELTASWTFGVLCVLLYCIGGSLSGCLIATLLAKYPKAQTCIITYVLMIGTAFLGLVGSLKGTAAWKVPSAMSLLAMIYNGLTSAVAILLIFWSIGQVGPILPACYSPVQPLTSLVVSSTLLGASVYLGSVLGAVLVIAGLLLFGWSKIMLMEQQLDLEQPML